MSLIENYQLAQALESARPFLKQLLFNPAVKARFAEDGYEIDFEQVCYMLSYLHEENIL